MVRRYEEPIEVRADADADVDARQPYGAVPSAFIWRGRLYLVQEVLGHWRERRAWWREALDPAERPDRSEKRDAHGAHGVQVVLSEPSQSSAPEQLEQEVWRVAASPGRMHATGVYDLGRDRQWRLLRVAD